MRFEQKAELMRQLLAEQKPLSEIQQIMHLSDYKFNKLKDFGALNGWEELRNHHPSYDLYKKDELPRSLMKKLTAGKSQDYIDSIRLIKAEKVGDNTIAFTCKCFG